MTRHGGQRVQAFADGGEEDGSARAEIEAVYGQIETGLATDWLELTPEKAFADFRNLPQEDRGALIAYAVARSLEARAGNARIDPVRQIVEQEALPNIREAWTPDAVFLGRLTKPALLAILSDDLGLTEEALSLANSKKSEIVDYLTGLFAEPYAGLGPEQRAAVEAWAPAPMVTPGTALEEIQSEADASPAPEGDPEGETMAMAAE